MILCRDVNALKVNYMGTANNVKNVLISSVFILRTSLLYPLKIDVSPEVVGHAHICGLYIALSVGKCPGYPRGACALHGKCRVLLYAASRAARFVIYFWPPT